MITALKTNWLRNSWLRGLKFKKSKAKMLKACIWNTGLYNIDRRLRAFFWASIAEFPDRDWTVTSAARYPVNKKSGHNYPVLSAIDIRSRTWTLEQMVEYKNWAEYWWGPWIDVVIEDERYDKKYEGKGPHIHIEIDKPFWKGL